MNDEQEISEGDFVWLGMDGPFTVLSIENDGKFRLIDMFGKDMDGSYTRKDIRLYGNPIISIGRPKFVVYIRAIYIHYWFISSIV